jgi:hypothetical protein
VLGAIRDEVHCTSIIETAISQLGGVDTLVNNAAYQMAQEGGIFDITAGTAATRPAWPQGRPDTFDTTGYVNLLERLREAGPATVRAPMFHRQQEAAIAGTIRSDPTPHGQPRRSAPNELHVDPTGCGR